MYWFYLLWCKNIQQSFNQNQRNTGQCHFQRTGEELDMGGDPILLNKIFILLNLYLHFIFLYFHYHISPWLSLESKECFRTRLRFQICATKIQFGFLSKLFCTLFVLFSSPALLWAPQNKSGLKLFNSLFPFALLSSSKVMLYYIET